jgi:acyl-CoA synthetase (AMP-forming)/AMP-acid ligase II
MPENISDLMTGLAAALPDRPAVIAGGRTLSFKELEAEISLLASGLAAAGIKPGTRVALMVPPSVDFAALTFALFRAGAVVVLIDPGIGIPAMKTCLSEARPEAFIGVTKAQAARVLLRWAKDSVKTLITVGPRLFWGGLTLEGVRKLAGAERLPATGETAAILFTSGSTGVPKGAVYTHAMFASQARMLKDYFQIEPGFYSVPTFPLFALFDLALGLTIVLPEMDFTRPAAADPAMLSGLISKYGAVQLFGSPALLDTLGRYGERSGARLDSLKRVISCGAPVSDAVIARIKKMIPAGTQVYTPYGATEALPVACISGDDRAALPRGRGVCVGRPWPGIEAGVIKISDEPIAAWSDSLLLPNGEIGELVVKGPTVSPEYFGRAASTKLAKICGKQGEIYHRMGDCGWKDAEGRLWFCGRKSHRVTGAEGTLFTIPCEAVFNAHPKVRRTALAGAGPAGRQVPVLFVELKKGERGCAALTEELLLLGAAHEQTRPIKTVFYHPAFPVDIRHNAKISREKLAELAARRLGAGVQA